jgi:hypothetical protein
VVAVVGLAPNIAHRRGSEGAEVAESFVCGGHWVDFSNGATESLFECWERLALADASTPGMTELAAYLRRSLDRGGPGGRAFGMDREFLPDELAGPAELAAVLAVVERTAEDPTLVDDVNWSPEAIASWRERLALMVGALRAGIGG